MATLAPRSAGRTLFRTEDSWALWNGLLVFFLALAALGGRDLLGWAATTNVWLDLPQALAPASAAYAGTPALLGLVATYLFLLALMALGAATIGLHLSRFLVGFSVIFWLSYLFYLLGNYAYVAATPDKRAAFNIPWSLGLTGEIGYLFALVAGLLLGNLAPPVARFLREASRPEWYVKTAIVILGASLGVQAAGATGTAASIILRGFAAIVEAYLIYWAVVYFVARKLFKFNREWAAPLASGISICGVSAAITTGAAIRARPVVPIMVSSLVVVFAVVEMLLLPLAAQTFLYDQPLVAGAWMGLAVKTDGAAVASGAIADALIRAKALATTGVAYKEGWVLLTTTTVKVFIDVFIGVWAFILSLVWAYGIEKRPGTRVTLRETWDRFPKFVLGYVATFAILFLVTLGAPDLLKGTRTVAAESGVFRTLFFAMTFFSIGLVSNFRALRTEGLGKLTLVYVVSLFGFIIWVGLAISFLFFGGVLPPAA